MYIYSVRIGKFRHLENETLGPFESRSKTSELIALAGPNGSGKSSVLELLSYALSSSYSLSWQLSRTFSDFSFEVGIGLTSDERKIVLEGISRDLEGVNASIKLATEEISAREAISQEQIQAQIADRIEQIQRPYKNLYAAIDYLKTNAVYYRSFNFEGEYAKNQTLHNQLHAIVTRELKDLLKRSLGFFLRADRHYPQKAFDQRRIFAHEGTLKKEHLWSMAFNTSEIQYQDMYEFLVQLRYHYLHELGAFHSQKNKNSSTKNEPEDPIQPYEELLQRLFPHYKFAQIDEPFPSNLFIEIPSGEVITFNDLSSGEKEVFFILSFFVRHNVENAIVVIDEPELHLHPELSRLLLRNMKSIRPGNQIWVATHNAEIVDEAGRDRVIYVTRDVSTRKSRFISAEDEQEAFTQLRDLFGLSGYIGVSRNLVFLEGDNSSQDRKFYSSLLQGKISNVKLVPANSSDHLRRINGAVLSILESNIGSMNFFVLRDRDYLTEDMAAKYAAHKSGRIFVLSRHEVENYLIDFESISTVLEEIFNIKRSGAELKQVMHGVAIDMAGSVIRDMTSFRLNLIVRPQDFALGSLLSSERYFDSDGCKLVESEKHGATLKARFAGIGAQINSDLSTNLSSEIISATLNESVQRVQQALECDDWLSSFPGKEMLEKFARGLGITHGISLQNSIIKQLASTPERIPGELTSIFAEIEKS